MDRALLQPIVTGGVAAVTGFAGSAAVVLAGLTAVGATSAQAASGLSALCVAQGAGMILLSRRLRMPVMLAWSTPGAALLAAVGPVEGGWRAAIGAFLVAALLTAVTAVWAPTSRLIARIPAPIAQAMLAGVLLPLCLKPVAALIAAPALMAPVVLLWLVVLRFAPLWATPAAIVAVLGITAGALLAGGGGALAAPSIAVAAPALTVPALLGIALPLVLVTMAGQNLPGAAIMAANGWRVPWRSAILTASAGTLLAAPFGGHALNLAAITAGLASSDQAGADRGRRWVAAQTCGWLYLVLGAVAPFIASLLGAAPAGLAAAVAGLALLPTLAAALAAAVERTEARIPALLTTVTAATPGAFLGLATAAWGLAIGLLAWPLLVRRPRR